MNKAALGQVYRSQGAAITLQNREHREALERMHQQFLQQISKQPRHQGRWTAKEFTSLRDNCNYRSHEHRCRTDAKRFVRYMRSQYPAKELKLSVRGGPSVLFCAQLQYETCRSNEFEIYWKLKAPRRCRAHVRRSFVVMT